jgi:hypothetical protein
MRLHNHPTKIKRRQVPGSALLLWLFLGWLCVPAGCVDVVTGIDFPEQDPRVVVHGFISPADTAVQVRLTWSNPTGAGTRSDSIRTIPGATVRIAGEGQAPVNLVYHPEKQVYAVPASAFPIREGQQYSLEVLVPGQEPIHASCSIPPSNRSLELTGFMAEEVEPGLLWRYELEYRFTDGPGEGERFYAPSAWLGETWFVFGEDTMSMGMQRFRPLSGESFLSNGGRGGRHFVQRAENYVHRWEWQETWQADTLYLLLLSTDEHYYRYHRDLEYYSPDNPFAEPAHIHSNIRGGLGVFAGFSRHELRLPVPAPEVSGETP